NDRAPEALLVRSHARREIRKRRLAAQLLAERLARRLELAPLAPHAARPCIATQGIDHRAAHAPLGERLELDPAPLVIAVRRIDEPEHPVLDEVADVNR